MKPGRELDALIAQMVFNHKVEWRDTDYARFPVRVIGLDGSTDYDEIPHYSTDFAAAIPILKRLGKDGLSYTYTGAGSEHEVIFFSPELEDWAEEVHAATAPLAICLAALKVLKVDL